MFISVSKLKMDKGTYQKYHFSFPLSYFGLEEKIGWFTVDFYGAYLKGKVFIKGECRISQEGYCDRCLKPMQIEQEETFDQEFTEVYEEEMAKQEEYKDFWGEEYLKFSGDDLNLVEYFRQLIITSAPLKKVCSHDCKGLCQICGKPLEEGCYCEKTQVDPRWLALEKLKQNIDVN